MNRYLLAILLLFVPSLSEGAVSSASAVNYVGSATIPVTDFPFTVLAYVNTSSTSGTRNPFRLQVDASNYVITNVDGTTNAISGGYANGGSAGTFTTASGFSADTWVPVAMVVASGTDRTVYLWDAIGGTRVSANSTFSRTFISSMESRVCLGSALGTLRVQDFAILDVALNTTQLDEWAAGKTALACSFVADVVGYQPLVSAVNESGYVGPSFSETGSPSWVAGPTLTGPSSGSPVPKIIQQLYRK